MKKSNAGIGFTLSTVFYGLMALALVFAVLVSVGVIDNPLGGEIIATAHDSSHSDPPPGEPDTQENAFMRVHATANTQGSGDIDHSGAIPWAKLKFPEYFDQNSSASGSGFGYYTFLIASQASTHYVRIGGYAWARAGRWSARDPESHDDDEVFSGHVSAEWGRGITGRITLIYGPSMSVYRYAEKSSSTDAAHDAASKIDVYTYGRSLDSSSLANPIGFVRNSRHSEQQTIEQR